jgi:hypothetical protein
MKHYVEAGMLQSKRHTRPYCDASLITDGVDWPVVMEGAEDAVAMLPRPPSPP